jgi:hypothetical protein
MLRDIKILAEGHDVPGLLSFLGAYLVPEREQVGQLWSSTLRAHVTKGSSSAAAELQPAAECACGTYCCHEPKPTTAALGALPQPSSCPSPAVCPYV